MIHEEVPVMTRLGALAVLAALAVAAPAHAQRWGGSPVRESGRGGMVVESHHAATAATAGNGTISQWGGSPAAHHEHNRDRALFIYPTDAYIPAAVAAPAAVPVTYVHDTVYTVVQQAPVQMQVVNSRGETPTPTTMDVYRQQARFKNRP
jgi:hypothetical protein